MTVQCTISTVNFLIAKVICDMICERFVNTLLETKFAIAVAVNRHVSVCVCEHVIDVSREPFLLYSGFPPRKS